MPGLGEGVYAAGVGIGKDPERAREQALEKLFGQYRARMGEVGNLEAAGKVAESWYDRSVEAHYALAVIAKKDVDRVLSRNIDEADSQVLAALREAWTTPMPVQQWGAYLRALQALDRRDALVAQRMVLSPSAVVEEAVEPRASVFRQAGESASRVGLDVRIANDRDGLVKTELIRELAARGVRLVPGFAANFQLSGTVVVETRVDDLGFPWYLASCQIKAKTAEEGTLQVPPARVGRRLKAGGEAEREARQELGKMLAGLVLDQIAAPAR